MFFSEFQHSFLNCNRTLQLKFLVISIIRWYCRLPPASTDANSTQVKIANQKIKVLRNCFCTHLQKSNDIKRVVKSWITLVWIQNITQGRGTKGLWCIFRFHHQETLPTFKNDIRNNFFDVQRLYFKDIHQFFYFLLFVNQTNYVSGHLRVNFIGKTIFVYS